MGNEYDMNLSTHFKNYNKNLYGDIFNSIICILIQIYNNPVPLTYAK